MPTSVNLVFSQNLRQLCLEKGSISEAARNLGISRVQMTRYIAGQSFPKPVQLKRICDYFEVDARIYVEPLELIGRPEVDREGAKPTLGELPLLPLMQQLALGPKSIRDGIHLFVRPSFHDPADYVSMLVLFRTTNGIQRFRVMDALGKTVRRSGTGSFQLRSSHGVVLHIGTVMVCLSTREQQPHFMGLGQLESRGYHRNGFLKGHYVVVSPRLSVETPTSVPMILQPVIQDAKHVLGAARGAGILPVSEMPEELRRVFDL